MMNAVYGLLRDLGIFTTKGIWPNIPHEQASDPGETCASEEYIRLLREMQAAGFEIGYHNATSHTSDRAHTLAGLDRFRDLFGHDPVTMSNHFYSRESIYFGDARLTGMHRTLYRLMRRNPSLGHVPGQNLFWGDLCRERVRYVRNFIFGDINTLRLCPLMPYHDPLRPFVKYWYCSSEGANVDAANRTLTEAAQDRLEEEGGACILYSHFGHGFATEDGQIDPRFRELITRLSRKNGWFVPVGTLLDFLRERQGHREIRRSERAALERRWLVHKARFGTA